MPLCGTKKTKKQKRDPSPPYTTRASIEEKDKELKALTDDNTAITEELKQEKNQGRILREEINRLQEDNKKSKDRVDGNARSIPAIDADDVTQYQNQLKEKEEQIEEEKKQRKEVDKSKQKLEDEYKEANKQLEEKNAIITNQEARNKDLEDEITKANKTLDTERAHRLKSEDEKEKYKREKDATETALGLTKQELEIAKRESHIPRSPTRAPSEEWKAKIQAAETEFKKERDNRMEKERDLSRVHSENNQLVKEKEQLEQQLTALKDENEEAMSNLKMNLENSEKNYKNDLYMLNERSNELNAKLAEEGLAKEALLTRLSAATAARVLDGNPNVSDLSDPNRPQKLGEQIGQLYDNEWTDASENLEPLNTNEDDIIKTLLDLITTVYSHCKELADNQLSGIDEYIFLPPLENQAPASPDTSETEPVKSPTSSKHSMSRIPRFTSHKGRPALPNMSSEKKTIDNESNGKVKDTSKRSLSFNRIKGISLPEVPPEVRKGIKEYRKRITKQVTPVIEKEVMNKLRANCQFGDKVVDACLTYISRCVELCWLMRVQDPPVSLSWDIPEDKSFDSEVYRAYTKSGTHIDYLVWPTMYLYEGGPILMKGVAQGMKQ